MNIQDLKTALLAQGIQGSPLAITELGAINRTELGPVQSSNGRLFFQVDDLRILTKTEALSKEVVTIKIIKAIRPYKNMEIGNCFAVAE